MKYPGQITVRRIDPDGDEKSAFESLGQAQSRLSKQIQNDRQRAVVNRNRELKRATTALQRCQDPPLRKQLRQKINRLQRENTETQKFL